MSENKGIGGWGAGIVATVVAGVAVALIVNALTGDGGNGDSSEPDPVGTTPPVPATRVEALAGDWTFEGWDERPSDITLGMEPISGTLQVTEDGMATWIVDIDDLFWEDSGPQSAVTCSGRIPIVGDLEASVTHTHNYTSNMMSARDGIAAAFCGGGVSAGNHPFVMTYAPASDPTRLEMANDLGRFTWRR